jgi:retinol dehydrogenase 14
MNMGQRRSGPMAGRTVLVTGGSGGIGRATALGLAAMGAQLAICGWDRESTEGAAVEVRAAGGGPVEVFVADLSSQSEVRRLAGEVLQRCSRIDVLVDNVGGYWDTRQLTAEGLERTFPLNHLAPSLLTNLLLDRLRNSAPACTFVWVNEQGQIAEHWGVVNTIGTMGQLGLLPSPDQAPPTLGGAAGVDT